MCNPRAWSWRGGFSDRFIILHRRWLLSHPSLHPSGCQETSPGCVAVHNATTLQQGIGLRAQPIPHRHGLQGNTQLYTAASRPRPKADALPAGGCILGVFWVYLGHGGGSAGGPGGAGLRPPGGRGRPRAAALREAAAALGRSTPCRPRSAGLGAPQGSGTASSGKLGANKRGGLHKQPPTATLGRPCGHSCRPFQSFSLPHLLLAQTGLFHTKTDVAGLKINSISTSRF